MPVDRHGQVHLEALSEMLDDMVAAVSIAAANSETGVINPLATIASLVHEAGAVFHSDATQLVGRLPVSMRRTAVDAISLSGHKMNGPQGIGALVANRRIRRQLSPIVYGGGHEDGLRSGSSNVAGIVGLGAAARVAADPDAAARMSDLRDHLTANLVACGGVVNGAGAARLPNTVNIRFPGAARRRHPRPHPTHRRIAWLTCNAGAVEPSSTLLAMGLDRTAAEESIRFSVTQFTTEADISAASSAIATTVAEVRRLTQEVA